MRPWHLITLILLLGALAVVYGWKPFWVLFYALTLAYTLAVIWLALSLRGLRFTRTTLAATAQVGDRLDERLALENHSWLPKLWVQLADGSTLPGHHAGYVSSVGPRQRISWRARTLCRQRGRYTLGPVIATTGDPLGLFTRSRTLAPATSLLVLPQVIDLRGFALVPGSLPGRGRGSQRSLHTSTNAVTVRTYVPGDALTTIHWTSTARHGHLMVKEFDLDPTLDVTILLDLDRAVHTTHTNQHTHTAQTVRTGHTSQRDDAHDAAHDATRDVTQYATQDATHDATQDATEEVAVTLAASLLTYLLRRRDLAVALDAPGPQGVLLGLDRGDRQAERALEALALVRAQTRVPLATALAATALRLTRHSALIVITPSTDLDWPFHLAALRRRGVHPAVLLLDPSTFDPRRPGVEHLEAALARAGVPCRTIPHGADLAALLEQPAS